MKSNKNKDFIWNLLGLTINSFNSFFFLIVVNRINGSESGGVFTYAYSLICLFYMIGIFYTRTYQVSDTSNNYTNKEYICSRSFSCTAMLLVTIISLLIFRYDYFKTSIIILLCLYRLVEAFADVFLGILQKEGFLYKAGFSLFVKGMIGLIVFILVDYFTKNLIISCVSIVLVNIIIFLIYDLHNTKKYIEKSYKLKNAFAILKTSFPVFIFTFLNIYLVNASKYILDIFDSASIQNVYGIILMPGTVLSLCAQYILNPYIVPLTNLYKDKKFKEYDKSIFKIIAIIFILGIACEFVVAIIGIPLLNLVYGIDLSAYKIELLVIIFGSIFVALIAVISSGLTIIKKNYIQVYIYIANCILTTIIAVLLINKFSIMGASLTYAISMIIQFCSSYLFYKNYINGGIDNEESNKKSIRRGKRKFRVAI